MSFNFKNFLDAMAGMLPAVGEAVIALHPNNPDEALKIRVGAELVKAIANTLHQSAAAPAPAAPEPSAPNAS